MINVNMRSYDYSTLDGKDDYGMVKSSGEVQGAIKMAIYISSQSIQENINYKDCSYVGITTDRNVNDKMVIHYGDEKLKVQYVNPQGRLVQVFLKAQ